MKQTTFGSIRTKDDLGLVLLQHEVQPAEPKLNMKEIPGADGSLDLTEAMGVGVRFKDREITWVFGLYPGDDWAAKRSEVSGALNGRAFHITLGDDEDYYYIGRVKVTNHETDRLLHRITVKAICKPYKLHQLSTVTRRTLTPEFKTIVLENDRMPAVPKITVSDETMIQVGSSTVTLSPGEYTIPDMRLTEGSNVFQAKTVSAESGTISVTWQEGAL